MSNFDQTESFLMRMARKVADAGAALRPKPAAIRDGRVEPPQYSVAEGVPTRLDSTRAADGRLAQYPPPDQWDDWVEWDSQAWPKKVARRYTLVPTVCFNCESACGLLAYVDKETFQIRKFEGNPAHPGSRGRNCAKGPATHNQIYDPERILYPLKRVGARGEGRWKRVAWDEAMDDIAERMRESRSRRRDGIMYHVGRPGEDHYTNRAITAWGVDGHNSHTNICSAASRAGYHFWSGADRPSPDFANARCILLISAHLESGHYFNPHAQRIIEAQKKGAKIITFDPRLSNTAAKSDVWLPSWPGSETSIILSIANHLLQTGAWNQEFVRRWVDWTGFLDAADGFITDPTTLALVQQADHSEGWRWETFVDVLTSLYREFTFERAAAESQVPEDRIRETAQYVANAGDRLAAHNWRAASMGNRGGWQVARSLFFLNVLTGSVGTEGGTSLNAWNKFVPKPYRQPPPFTAWNELHMPVEYPFAFYEMSFLLPHFLEEGRGEVDVYFTRVYNPLWINPDGFMWLEALRDETKMKFHVAMTPTWNESAWFADYVLPFGHAGERHDLMSQETHAGQWLAFRQPVRRVAMERAGQVVSRTFEANPGEVWEEAEFWVDLSWKLDPDGALGIREYFESPVRPGEPVSMDEYFGWIFEHSVPGLPEVAEAEGLTPLAYMRKYGAFEVSRDRYVPYEEPVDVGGVQMDDGRKTGFKTPSGKLELFSATVRDWGWPEQEYVVPWPLESHVSPENIDREAGEMLLLPNFRLPTLIHTRSANAKWLYELSHKNPVWIHPSDAERIGVVTGDLMEIETEIGTMVDSAWVTEGIKPGIIAISHHLGRWRLKRDEGIGAGMSALVELEQDGTEHGLRVQAQAAAWTSPDPDTARIWWQDVGVHQNLTHAVHPDPISGAHCWHQKALRVTKAPADARHGDVRVDTAKSMAVYREWLALSRPATKHSPNGDRRPQWLKRPLRPTAEAYKLPALPAGETA